MRKLTALALGVGIIGFFVCSAAQATDAVWAGGSGNWSTSNAANAGWVGAIPDAIGDTATFNITGKSSATTTQDLTGSRTVGAIQLTGGTTENSSWQITLNSGKNLILNEDGGGPGTALISITTQSNAANPAIIMNGGAGIITLNDDLLIKNDSTATRTGGSIEIDPQIQGVGNITFYSVSNTIGSGHIALFRTGAGASNFSGNITIAKGAVTFNRGDRFSPNPSNVITIGRSDGAATLEYSNTSLGNMENNFATSATAGGELLFGTTNAATGLVNIKSSNTNAAFFTLNGNLSFTSGSGGGTLQIGDPIIGVGAVTKKGPGPMRVTNTNSYSGGTEVAAGSLAVGHTDAINNGFGFYDATDGTLGTGNVTVDSTATDLEIESGVAGVNVIADSKTLSLAGGGTAGVADNGYALLDSGIDETVGGLILGGIAQTTPGTYGSSTSGAMFQNDEFFSGDGLITLTPAGLAGDFNHDGIVDAADYVVWRRGGSPNPNSPGDYATWRANFGNASGAGSGLHSRGNAVPEPGSMLLLAVGAVASCLGRRSRSAVR